ncbi:putative thymidylate kinase [Dissostichus eleginoides]|uniref:Thymidylate kinase n=1 Tax=Dissostichus eleginoides TaxID=100907 RepID=A0AAD9B3E8_DISEL|nr:putative thymidylate kinase [Dissostichus eleginoides]
MMAIREALYDQINPQNDKFSSRVSSITLTTTGRSPRGCLMSIREALHHPHNHGKESQRMLDVHKGSPPSPSQPREGVPEDA